MKFLIVVVALVAVASAMRQPIHQKIKLPSRPMEFLRDMFDKMQTGANPKQISANANGLMDVIVANIPGFFAANGLEPLNMPDLYAEFSYKPILITYHGHINTWNGWVHQLSTIHRTGNVDVKYENSFLNLRLPVGFTSLGIDADYNAEIMGLGPSGQIIANVNDVQFFVDVILDLYFYEVTVTYFEITNIGAISVELNGNSLIDWLLELLVDVCVSIFHDTLVGILNDQVQNQLQSMVAGVNSAINTALNPTVFKVAEVEPKFKLLSLTQTKTTYY